eukprot:scaffold79253_cov51-Phaeocystis_antarctica.AAC.1
MASARAATPSEKRLLDERLRAREGRRRKQVLRVSMGADTKANTRGRGALEVGDLRLFEDGGERGGALGQDGIVRETAR